MPQISVPDDPKKLEESLKVDLAVVARDLKLPPEKVEKTVELLDEGNTIPFITRFRKDLTGGLNEQQILAVKQRLAQLRALAERKSFVLKSIESQSKLTDGLRTQINRASTSRRLEDLYLPFKTKKQSRASLARQQGLEPLAEDIFVGASPDVDLATRSTDFVRVDKGLNSVDEVIKGVGDLLAERFSENDELRSTLRRIMWNDGKLESYLVVAENVAPEKTSTTSSDKTKSSSSPKTASAETDAEAQDQQDAVSTKQAKLASATDRADSSPAPLTEASPEAGDSEGPAETSPESSTTEKTTSMVSDASEPASAEAQTEASEESKSNEDAKQAEVTDAMAEAEAHPKVDADETTSVSKKDDASDSAESNSEANPTSEGDAPNSDSSVTSDAKITDTAQTAAEQAAPVGETTPATKPKKKKKKKKKKVEDPFADYRDFKQPLKQIPHHRILAINRGERAGSLKVKIKVEGDKLTKAAYEALVPAKHPSIEFLQKCANDALNRLIIPSLEREIRRELTEAAEKHAVEVFANNLRNLLLQPPIRNRTILAIDPGFKRGCSVAVLDTCGNLLDSGHTFVVGNQSRRDESKQKIVDWVKKHKVDVIAIGNGAACRQTEQMVSDVIGEHLKDLQVRYVMVNEAGASIYSTSEIGREELPDAAPSIRSAVSIGRRLQDPLSELVKISPANIGVGMYQHDVKAKHLSESLDDVVEFCVNRVGVNVNSASPSLLKYVSGLNALTARRVVEYRQTNGQFKNREELKQVSGFGDATFVQAAGFLRIHGGDHPLDCTSIHPESYNIANDVLKRVETSTEELFPADLIQPATPVPASTPETKTESESESTPEVPTVVSPPTESTPTDAGPSELAEPSIVESTGATANSDSGESQTEDSKAVSESEDPTTTASTTLESTPSDSAATASPTEGVSSGTDSTTSPDLAASETSADSTTQGSKPRSENSAERESQIARRKEILKKITDLDVDQLASDHSAGVMMVKDILLALKKPKWDPRDKVSKPIFRRGIIKADDLKPEMQLDAQVVNVVDFGVFVDIGLGESSLVHVSQLSSHFIRDPHSRYSVGDVLKVWVSEVDSERRRVKLTAIRPGAKKPQGRRKPAQRDQEKSGSGRATKFGNKYGGGRPKGKRGGSPKYDKGSSRYIPNRKSKPKPVKPITDDMLQGKEPMRSFSDLAQFVSNKPSDKKDGSKKGDA